MAFPASFNLRSTAAFVTDGAGETFAKEGTPSVAEVYPVTRDSITFGNVTVSAPCGTRDRSNTADRRFAGCWLTETNGDTTDFRVDLPATGDYDIRFAVGIVDIAFSDQKVEVFDDTTSLFTVSGSTLSDEFMDATGAKYSSANWPGSNAAVRKTFATTIFKLRLGNATGRTAVAHIEISAVDTGVASVFVSRPIRSALRW